MYYDKESESESETYGDDILRLKYISSNTEDKDEPVLYIGEKQFYRFDYKYIQFDYSQLKKWKQSRRSNVNRLIHFSELFCLIASKNPHLLSI